MQLTDYIFSPQWVLPVLLYQTQPQTSTIVTIKTNTIWFPSAIQLDQFAIDFYWTSRENSLEVKKISSLNEVTLVEVSHL
jgi:hypothetical protein